MIFAIEDINHGLPSWMIIAGSVLAFVGYFFLNAWLKGDKK